MEGIPKEILKKKNAIKQEFERIRPEGASLDVTPVLPDRLNIEIVLNEHHKVEKTIHYNEEPFLRKLLRFHSLL